MTHTCSKGWGARCPASKGPRCKCRCGGYNHGNPKARPDHDAGDETMELTPSKKLYYGPDETPARLTPEEILQRDERTIRFERYRETPDSNFEKARVILVTPGVFLGEMPMPRWLVHHSPTGFEFGYGGSGPADLALNILALVVSPKEAMHLHQQFKWDHIANKKAGDTLTLATVREWIARTYADEIAADQASESGDPYTFPGMAVNG